jgi:hypothetical protein
MVNNRRDRDTLCNVQDIFLLTGCCYVDRGFVRFDIGRGQ